MAKNVKKVPIIMQMEAVECGAASLAMILAYYKKYVPLEEVRIACNVSRDGSSAKYIILAAKHYGMEAKGYKMSLESLKQETAFPIIIHWNFNHFVVLCGFKGNKAVINDPAGGTILVGEEEFNQSYTGIVLKFSPGKSFECSGKPKSIISFICKRMKGNGSIMAVILLFGAVLSFLELWKPVFYKIFTDNILIGGFHEWMKPLILGMLLVLVVGFIAESVRSICFAKFQAKMCIGSSASFMWHVLRLPVAFFSQRFTGDVVCRQQSNNRIAYVLCYQLAPIILDIVMIGVYLIMMIFYNAPLAMIGVGAAILNIIVMKRVSSQNVNDAKAVQRDEGKLSGITVAAISMIETIKASGSEYGMFEKISGYQAKYNNQMVCLKKRNLIVGIIPELLTGISTGLVLMLGVYYIFSGELTIGSLMAFQSFMNLFLSPVGSMLSSVQEFQEMCGDMERVDDVMDYPAEEKNWLSSMDTQEHECTKLSGEVEISHLCFAYSPLAPNLINDISVKAKSGQMIALVGGSGSGKSTIAKIVSGLYKARSGEVTFDNIPIGEIDRYVFTNSVAVVDQNISMFSGTVRENVTMWDTTISEETLVTACKDACIHDDIMCLADGYDYIIAENGENFSGGQCQRIEIARAFAAEPSILILDEATSALDPITERDIMDAVKRRGITCFVIAHRLSTIRDADEIIMLADGCEVERGTHEQLMALDGEYAKLVRQV